MEDGHRPKTPNRPRSPATGNRFGHCPFHEAMIHRARRARYGWHDLGLTGAHGTRAPTGRRFPAAVACVPVLMTAVVPAYRCGTVPDSHRVPSHVAPRSAH